MADRTGAFLKHTITTRDIIDYLSIQGYQPDALRGCEDLIIRGVCDSRSDGKNQLVFSTSEHYSSAFGLSDSLVLINNFPNEESLGSNHFLKVADPKAVFIGLLQWLVEHVGVDAHKPGFSQTASVSAEADISSHAVIEAGVEIGAGTTVCAGAVIKSGTWIGRNTVIRENVVIGSDGISIYRANDGSLLKFPHVGGVFIGDETEIGANTVIAGGILAPTCIEHKVVIGNLCNVGHCAQIGQSAWMSVGSLIAGHTRVHAGSTIAMGVTVRDNITIGERASLGMGSVVIKSVEPEHSIFGNPAKRVPRLKTGPKR